MLPIGAQNVDVSPRCGRRLRRHDHVVRIDAVLGAKTGAKGGAALRRFPRVELLAERHAAHCQSGSVQEPGTAEVQHDLGYAPSLKHLHGWMVLRTVRQRVHETRHPPADIGPVGGARAAETCGVGHGGQVQDQVRRPAEGGVGHHRVLKRGVGQNLAHRDAAVFEPHQRRRRPLCHIEPDRVPGGCEGGMAERHPKRFGDDLRRGRRAEELAAPARGRTGAAAEIGGILQRNLIVHVAHANRLDARGILAFHRQQRDAARDEHAGQVVHAGQRHHHRRQPFIAGRDAEHTASGRQRSDQPAEHRRRVVAIGQAVEHRRRALRPSVARIGAGAGERDRARCLELTRRRFHQQADFPVSGVIPEGDRRAVWRANPAVRRENQELAAGHGRRFPAHARVLAPAEQVAGRTLAQHLGGERQGAGRSGHTGGNVEQRAIA